MAVDEETGWELAECDTLGAVTESRQDKKRLLAANNHLRNSNLAYARKNAQASIFFE
jgi:hypothetical protein